MSIYPLNLTTTVFKSFLPLTLGLFSHDQTRLATLFEDLLHEVRNPATPDAVCRHQSCANIVQSNLLPQRNAIYQVLWLQRFTDFGKTCFKNSKSGFKIFFWQVAKEENNFDLSSRASILIPIFDPFFKLSLLLMQNLFGEIFKSPSKMSIRLFGY